jgi:hypothetical protein
MSDITRALRELRPSAVWTVDGNTYEGITWLDEHQTKPTKAEVDAHLAAQVMEYQQLEYQRKRVVEYPPITQYIDGVVKGDQAQIQAYIDTCMMVKRKYPKP